MNEDIKSEFEKKPWLASLLVAVLFVALVLGVVQYFDKTIDDTNMVEPHVELDKSTCTDSGGEWDSCGSACRGEEAHDPDVACIEVCVEYCHCTHDGECPYNHHCDEIIEETGICVIDF